MNFSFCPSYSELQSTPQLQRTSVYTPVTRNFSNTPVTGNFSLHPSYRELQSTPQLQGTSVYTPVTGNFSLHPSYREPVFTPVTGNFSLHPSLQCPKAHGKSSQSGGAYTVYIHRGINIFGATLSDFDRQSYQQPNVLPYHFCPIFSITNDFIIHVLPLFQHCEQPMMRSHCSPHTYESLKVR